jgi:hypothetical protein
MKEERISEHLGRLEEKEANADRLSDDEDLDLIFAK